MNLILKKYIHSTYWNLLNDVDFQKVLSNQGWLIPAVIPKQRQLITQKNDLITKYLVVNSNRKDPTIFLVWDKDFQKLMYGAGFTIYSSTTTTTTTA